MQRLTNSTYDFAGSYSDKEVIKKRPNSINDKLIYRIYSLEKNTQNQIEDHAIIKHNISPDKFLSCESFSDVEAELLNEDLITIPNNSDLCLQFDSTDMTLQYICIKGNLNLVKELKKNSFNFNSLTSSNETCLHIAALYNNSKAFEILSELVSDETINCQENITRSTALHIAIINQNIEIVCILLRRNCDIYIQDIYGNDASLHLNTIMVYDKSEQLEAIRTLLDEYIKQHK